MSYEEKGQWVYLVVILGTYGAYLGVILGRADGIALIEVSYVAPMLWSIAIAIALSIIGRIAVEIAKPSETYQTDARDKDINRFGAYVGGVALAVATGGPFGLTLAGADRFWIANAMYVAFVLSALLGTSVKLVAYRRGL
jgi:hypothetical protein